MHQGFEFSLSDTLIVPWYGKGRSARRDSEVKMEIMDVIRYTTSLSTVRSSKASLFVSTGRIQSNGLIKVK